MKITITKEIENPLMNRKVVSGEVVFDGATPGRYEMKLEIAKELKLNPALVILRRVLNVFGDRKVIFEVHTYKNEKDLEKINKVILDKNKKPAPKAGAEEKPAEEKKPEAKKEKPAEEKKPEEKKEKPAEKHEAKKETPAEKPKAAGAD